VAVTALPPTARKPRIPGLSSFSALRPVAACDPAGPPPTRSPSPTATFRHGRAAPPGRGAGRAWPGGSSFARR